ncbi:hypothetical protein, partial [Achromobacter spanius]|uniref:hypothetical protein n=1 Tax=Achromobacter spanius TaxID=217203 RepID=UPI003F68EF38
NDERGREPRIPAFAGMTREGDEPWIPAFAGMTSAGDEPVTAQCSVGTQTVAMQWAGVQIASQRRHLCPLA